MAEPERSRQRRQAGFVGQHVSPSLGPGRAHPQTQRPVRADDARDRLKRVVVEIERQDVARQLQRRARIGRSAAQPRRDGQALVQRDLQFRLSDAAGLAQLTQRAQDQIVVRRPQPAAERPGDRQRQTNRRLDRHAISDIGDNNGNERSPNSTVSYAIDVTPRPKSSRVNTSSAAK